MLGIAKMPTLKEKINKKRLEKEKLEEKITKVEKKLKDK